MTMEGHRIDSKRRLEEYYGSKDADKNPYDINSSSFDPELFSQRLVKEASLSQLLHQEDEIVKQIQSLDSDMQTLVYENYNKFISATDVIKKMRVDFREMEDEMDRLASKMKNITVFSTQIEETLKDRRLEISKLSSSHSLLKRLQFLLELPSKLQERIEEGDYVTAVDYYLRAQRVLDRYKMPEVFNGIKQDCDDIINNLKQQLKDETRVDLLLRLNENREDLCDLYLKSARSKLEASLSNLEEQIHYNDVLEFVDLGCNGFVSDACLLIASYLDILNDKDDDDNMALTKLIPFIDDLTNRYMNLVKRKVELETDLNDTPILVRALDRFYRRLQAMNRLIPAIDFNKTSLGLILDAAKSRCDLVLTSLLRERFEESVMDTRHRLAVPVKKSANEEADLNEINSTLLTSVTESIKNKLNVLQAFIDPELTFSAKTDWRKTFCRKFVREGVVVAFLNEIVDLCRRNIVQTSPPILVLLLSRFCNDSRVSVTRTALTFVDQQFLIDQDSTGLTTLHDVDERFRTVSEDLLNHYVRLQGQIVSQMLKKSVETRDWLNTAEPRAVRAVMKRIVEEVNEIDRRVGRLYEEGDRKSSSDSSRRTKITRWSVDTSGLASNIQKMFSERIEIFEPVSFSKVSVLTGVIKIALKTLMECVRLRTFSRYGFQQLQVDCHYLHLYLWRFVSDENLVTFLLDEIMTSAVHRCIDPSPMDHSIVEVICDQS